jgi:hypothetical protein
MLTEEHQAFPDHDLPGVEREAVDALAAKGVV